MAVKPPCAPSFFKILVGDFEDKLKIPPAFVKHLYRKPLAKFVLKIRSGRVWIVKVKKVVNDFYFGKGWQNFVKDNSLQKGEFLVFCYDGDQSFDVQLFGMSGCENVEVVVDLDTYSSEEAISASKKQKKAPCTEYFAKGILPCQCYNNEKWKGRQILSKDLKFEREAISDEAYCPLKLMNPHFCITWTKDRLYRQSIPRILVEELRRNFMRKERVTLRDPHGRLWHVKIVFKLPCSMAMTAGLVSLYHENKLQEGDVCCFEFIRGVGRGVRSVFQVHISKRESQL